MPEPVIDPNLFILKISPETVFSSFRQEILELLKDFSSLYSVPIALILNGRQEYLSNPTEMASYCRVLWGHEELRARCLRDHESRAGQKGEHLAYRPCHAGLFNLSLSLDLGELGKGTLLAGQRSGIGVPAELATISIERHSHFLREAEDVLSSNEIISLEQHWQKPNVEAPSVSPRWSLEEDFKFVRALGNLLESYLRRRYQEEIQKMRFERGVSRLLHELSNTSVYMDLNASGLIKLIDKSRTDPDALARIKHYAAIVRAMALENRYECLNLLNALKGDSSSSMAGTEPEWIDVMDVLRDLWPAFTFLAEHEGKAIRFESPQTQDLATARLPKIPALSATVRRAIYNVFSNALKYSFSRLSLRDQDRYILVKATPRYSADGAMFALSFSNYGIPFQDLQEKQRATEFGFRGKAAVAERPIGSGIGLNEVYRIMKTHGGFVRIDSEPIGKSPALTVVWLIFRTQTHLSRRR